MSRRTASDAGGRAPGRDDQLSVAAWLLAGRPEQVAGVRRWAQAVAAAWGAAAADTGLVVTELVTNAIRHTRSGWPGGTVMVAVAGGWDGVTVHVHDLGAVGGQVPRPRSARGDGLAESGRGLPIVAAVGQQWGTVPAAWCPVWEPGDPDADASGRCTWCRLTAVPHEQHQDGKEGAVPCTP
jgi:serine/threonine-protein kinase RsbW